MRRASSPRGENRQHLRDPANRPVFSRQASRHDPMSEVGLDQHGALTAARPQAVGALLRYFHDLDTAEEAYQEACLRALQNWPPQWPAARSGRVADAGRAQRRGRWRAPARQAPSAAAGRGALRTRRRGDAAGGAAGRFAVPRRRAASAVHLLPSRPARDAADPARAVHRLRPDRGSDRPRLSGERGGDGTAHHARQGRVARADVAFEAPGAGNAPNGWGPSRR